MVHVSQWFANIRVCRIAACTMFGIVETRAFVEGSYITAILVACFAALMALATHSVSAARAIHHSAFRPFASLWMYDLAGLFLGIMLMIGITIHSHLFSFGPAFMLFVGWWVRATEADRRTKLQITQARCDAYAEALAVAREIREAQQQSQRDQEAFETDR